MVPKRLCCALYLVHALRPSCASEIAGAVDEKGVMRCDIPITSSGMYGG